MKERSSFFSPSRKSAFISLVVVLLFALAIALPARRAASSDGRDEGARSSARKRKSAPARASSPISPFALTADTRRVLATADFDLIGLAVTVSPASQTVPKNTPTAVLTSIQTPPGVDPAPIVAGLNPNFRIRGELTGPSLSSPLMIEASIGQPLQIPALQTAGDHLLQNLRVVDTGATGAPTIAQVTPDSAGIVVIEQLLISQVNVEEMTKSLYENPKSG